MSLLLINIVGHNSSGKSTLTEKLAAGLQLNRINGDDFRKFVIANFPYFKGMELSVPEERHTQYLSPLVIQYRFAMARTLLQASQSVVMDGSGATKAHRKRLFDTVCAGFSDIKKVIIYCNIEEKQLINRLQVRDQESPTNEWVKVYTTKKKALFEPPAPDEADELLVYDQNNYDVIAKALRELLMYDLDVKSEPKT